ncbi:poly(hydroxyalkanoate) granule-associated protein [Massilia violacea]|uniref:Poly(Hydroxyalkanoate) granule-associated protein n=2 Tax=Pseudoduganella violacea TaxID=1715466 RepID=A0A7W5FT79_9BURK|nr:poly(hydroxyalkanoate) granule-associated protein [Pseudoduganella violacea]
MSDEQMAKAVRRSAQQVWQAGLGAFAELQKRSREPAKAPAAEVRDTMSSVSDGVGRHADGSWDRLEQIFEERVTRALISIGVPMRKDIDALIARVEELSGQIEALKAGAPAPKKSRTKAAPVAEFAVKAVKTSAAAKKPAVKKAEKAIIKTSKSRKKPA